MSSLSTVFYFVVLYAYHSFCYVTSYCRVTDIFCLLNRVIEKVCQLGTLMNFFSKTLSDLGLESFKRILAIRVSV